MATVAVLIPTMNRPDFLLRQLRFYEMMHSPHPVYLSDSSNPENAEKIKNGIKEIKNFEIVYQWAEPGKDYAYQLMPLIKEKYSVRVGDEDMLIPATISACADFLEKHPDYGTCAGKQINIRFRPEDHNKPYGIIAYPTTPINNSLEDDDMLIRIKNFQPDTGFICFAVTRVETEKSIRDITKNFSLTEDMMEFLLNSMLIISGKFKVLDALSYIMQVSDLRTFDHTTSENFELTGVHWKICRDKYTDFIQKKWKKSRDESSIIAKTLYISGIANMYSSTWLNDDRIQSKSTQPNTVKKLRHFFSKIPLAKNIYYRLKPPPYVDRPESKYFKDFKLVKDFLEKGE
jgi:glycosyltransferase domain-containing protein